MSSLIVEVCKIEKVLPHQNADFAPVLAVLAWASEQFSRLPPLWGDGGG